MNKDIFSPERRIGQNEAWELAIKMISSECNGGFNFCQLKEIFGTSDFFEVMTQNTYAETLEKIRTWENRNKFHVGDVIEHTKSETIGVIISVFDPFCDVLTGAGDTDTWTIKHCIKTGRVLPVEDWLRQIGEE